MPGPNILTPQSNVLVTPDPFNAFNRYDTYLAVDPTQPNYMVGICRGFYGSGANYQDVLEFQSSEDGGQTWSISELPLAGFYSISDPWIGIGPNTYIYVIALLVTATDSSGVVTTVGSQSAAGTAGGVSVCCYTSTDGGNSWSMAVIPGSDAGSPDNTFGAIDPNTGNVYAIWNISATTGFGFGSLGFAWSADGSKWNSPANPIPGDASQYAVTNDGFNFVNMCVASDSSIHIIGLSAASTSAGDESLFSYARSTDSGNTFQVGVIAAQQPGTGDISGATNPLLAPVNPPAIVAAGGGLLFAAWSVDTGMTAGIPGPQMRIAVASCSDGGAAWSTNTTATAPMVVPQLALGDLPQTQADQYFQPRLAVIPSPNDGGSPSIGCTFLHCNVVLPIPGALGDAVMSTCLAVSALTHPGALFFDSTCTTCVVVSTASVSPVSSNEVLRHGQNDQYFIGDFIGLGATNLAFLPYWSDTRNGSAQIMTCSVQVLTTQMWSGEPLSPPTGVEFVPGTLAVITDGHGCLEVFAVNQNDGNVWNAFQQSPGGGWNWASDGQAWHPLTPPGGGISLVPNPSLYGPMQSPAVVLRSGALEVFAVSSEGLPFRIAQGESGGTNGWGQWVAMTPPSGGIWSITALPFAGLALVIYSTDQGVFYDVGGLIFGITFLPEFWVGPQLGPSNVGVNIVRANPYDSTIVGMALGNPETFFTSQFSLGWTPWQTGPSDPGPGNATLQDYRIAYLFETGFEIYGVRRFDGSLILAINGINSVDSWTSFLTLSNGPFQYGVLDVAALPTFQGPQHGEFEAFIFQFNCVFVTDPAGGVLQLVPVLGSNGNLTFQPFGPFILDSNNNGHYGPISTLAVGVNQDSRLEVFVLEPNNQCYHWWQASPDPQLEEFGLSV